MDTPLPAVGSTPASTTTPPADAPEPTVDQFRAELSKFSTRELDTLLEPQAPVAPKPEPTTAAPAATAPAATTDSAAATPPAPSATPPAAKTPKDEEDEEAGEDGIKRMRVVPHDFREQEVLRLMKPREGKPGLTLQEAYQQVYGNQSPTAKPDKPQQTTTEPATPPDPTAQIKADITTKQSAIADLEKQIAKATEDMDLAAVSKLTRDAARLERDVERLTESQQQAEAQAKQTAAQQAEQTFRQTEATYTKLVLEAYPQLGDAKSAERAEFNAFIEANFKNPDTAPIFDSPKWPQLLAREFAESKGWQPAKAKAKETSTAAAPATPAAPAATVPTLPPVASAARATAASVLAPGAPGDGSTFTPTKEQLTADLGRYSARELDEMLAGGKFPR